MTALAAARISTTPLDPGHVLPYCFGVPQKGNTEIFFGALVALDASGYAVPASATNTLLVIGWHDQAGNIPDGDSSDTTGLSDGARYIRVRQGCAPWAQSGTTITASHIGSIVYCVDDQTVSLSSSSGARPRVGIVVQVDDGGVWVQTAIGLYPGLARAVNAWTQTYSTANRTVAAPTATVLTDNGGGATADGTIGAITAPTALTDSTGGSASATLAAITSPTAVTNNTGGSTADTTLAAITTGGGTYPDATPVKDALAKLAVLGNANAAAVILLKNDVASLAARQAENRTAIVALTDAVKELSTAINLLIADDLDNRQSINALVDDSQAAGIAA